MDLQQLRYFLTLAKTGSFVRAAEEESVAQPSLSQQIKKLETSLGAPLFDRLGRGVRLTHYGQALVSRAEQILRSVGDAEKELLNLRQPDRGRLTVGCDSDGSSVRDGAADGGISGRGAVGGIGDPRVDNGEAVG